MWRVILTIIVPDTTGDFSKQNDGNENNDKVPCTESLDNFRGTAHGRRSSDQELHDDDIKAAMGLVGMKRKHGDEEEVEENVKNKKVRIEKDKKGKSFWIINANERSIAKMKRYSERLRKKRVL